MYRKNVGVLRIALTTLALSFMLNGCGATKMGTNAPTSEKTSDSYNESTTEPSAGDNMGGMTGDETSTNEERVTYEVTTKPIETGSGNSSEIATKEPTTKNTATTSTTTTKQESTTKKQESTTKKQEPTTATPTLPPSTTKKPEPTTKKKEESTSSTTPPPSSTEPTTEIDYYSHSVSDCADGTFPYWYQCIVHQRPLETREEILKAFLEGWNNSADNPSPCYADYCPNKWTYEDLDPVLCEGAMNWSKTMAEKEELFHSGLGYIMEYRPTVEEKLGVLLIDKEGVGVIQHNTYEEIYVKGYTLHHHIIDEHPFRALGIGYAFAENGKVYFTVAALPEKN